MNDQEKRAISICEAMADIPQQSPRTPLIWAYEVKAQRDELLAVLKEAEHFLHFHEDAAAPHMLRIRNAIEKAEATK